MTDTALTLDSPGSRSLINPFQPDRRKALEVEKPECLKEEHLLYLDQLRESGVTNMFGAVPYILLEFPDLKRAASEAGPDLLDENLQ